MRFYACFTRLVNALRAHDVMRGQAALSTVDPKTLSLKAIPIQHPMNMGGYKKRSKSRQFCTEGCCVKSRNRIVFFFYLVSE